MSTKYRNNCEPCLRENSNIGATFYCRECLEMMCGECKRHHLKYTLSANHKLCAIGVNDDLSELKSTRKLSKCPDHDSEEVKYLCKNHGKLCCNQCAIATHRKCERVVSLADEVKESSKKNKTRTRLQQIGEHLDTLLAHETKYQTSVQASTDEIKEFLVNLKVKLDKAYDILQQKVLLDLTKKSEETFRESKSQEGAVNELKTDVKQSLDSLNFAAKFGHDVHTYIKEKELSVDLQQKEDSMKMLHSQASAKLVELVEKKPLHEFLDSLSDCLDVDIIAGNRNLPPCPGYKDFKLREVTLIKEIDIQEGGCFPRYCIWVGKYIVVSFQVEKKLKMIDQESGNISEQKLSNIGAWAMTVLDELTFAVMSSNIEIMKINSSGCQLLRTIHHPGVSTTAGVSFNKNEKRLIVLSQSEGTVISLSIDDVDEVHAGTIVLDQKAKEAAKGTSSIAFDNKLKILHFSSSSSNKICTINMTGETLFEYTNENLEYPYSAVIDSDSNIYVASSSKSCIQQINKSGMLIRNLITSSNGIISLKGICFNDTMTKFAVTCDQNGKELKIYKFE